MDLPTKLDLISRDDLVPIVDVADLLEEAIASVAKFKRKATVTLTYTIDYDNDVDLLTIDSTVKSKRPVRVNRNEEVIGDDEQVMRMRREIEGQEEHPALDPKRAG